MVRSFAELRNRKQIKKTTSTGITFKFGNDGFLESTYAAPLPRKRDGWIKVEVFFVEHTFEKS